MSDHYTYSINDLFEQWRMTDSISARESIEKELNERIVPRFYKCNTKGDEAIDWSRCVNLTMFTSDSIDDENYLDIKVDPSRCVFDDHNEVTKIAFKRSRVNDSKTSIEDHCLVPIDIIEKIMEPGHLEKLYVAFYDQCYKNYKRHYENLKYKLDHLEDTRRELNEKMMDFTGRMERAIKKKAAAEADYKKAMEKNKL